MFAFFGSNNRHGTPHHETIKWFQSEAYCRIHVYEKPTGITGWLLGLAAFRELLAKLLCTKRKSASAPRCLRCLGATIDIVNSITRTANRSGQGVFSHRCLRKANTEDTVITGLGGLPGITALPMPMHALAALPPVEVVAPVVIALLFIVATSAFREPHRQHF